MAYSYGFILLSVFATVMCRPQEHNPAAPLSAGTPVPIVSQTESIDANGNFNYSFETGNGIKVEEAGVVKHLTGLRARGNFAADSNVPDEDDIIAKSGSFSYTAPDGTVISLRYTADENGFQPIGDHLPTSPPIPADIQRSLAQIQEQQPQQSVQVQQQQPIEQPTGAPTNFDVVTA